MAKVYFVHKIILTIFMLFSLFYLNNCHEKKSKKKLNVSFPENCNEFRTEISITILPANKNQYTIGSSFLNSTIWTSSGKIFVESNYNSQGASDEYIKIKFDKLKDWLELHKLSSGNYPSHISAIYINCPFIYYRVTEFKLWDIGYRYFRFNFFSAELENSDHPEYLF